MIVEFGSPVYVAIYKMKTHIFQLQIINVYNQEYESGAAFWPDVHFRVIIALLVSQIVLMGLLTTKKAASSTPFLIVLPILTIWFHRYCKGRFESAFVKFPLQVGIHLWLWSLLFQLLCAHLLDNSKIIELSPFIWLELASVHPSLETQLILMLELHSHWQ